MKIFISWSGEPSQTFAKALAEWLRMVIQAVKPFMSTNDIRSGQRWLYEIGKELEENTFGIICLTPSNTEEPWILFEAGALSKSVSKGAVVPLRIGIENEEITPALSQFQSKNVTKDDMLALVTDINSRLESRLADSVLHKSFEKSWPDLELAIQSALEAVKHPEVAPTKRPNEDMAAETLNTVRALAGSIETHFGALRSALQIPQTPAIGTFISRRFRPGAGIEALLGQNSRADSLRDYFANQSAEVSQPAMKPSIDTKKPPEKE